MHRRHKKVDTPTRHMLKYPSSSYPIIRYTYPDINTVTQNRKTRLGHDQKILVKYARTVNKEDIYWHFSVRHIYCMKHIQQQKRPGQEKLEETKTNA